MKHLILRNLNAASQFADANTDQVLDVLDAVVSPAVRLYGVGFLQPSIERGPQLNFYKTVPADFRAELEAEENRRGPSILVRCAANDPPPFTFAELMQRRKPSGKDRWFFDLHRDYGVCDPFYCPHWPWLVVFKADRLQELTHESRAVLDVAARMAVHRLKEIAGHAALDASAEQLTPREKTALQYLSDGISISDIADRLALSEPTVKTFVRRATKKLNASSQLHAVALAVRNRLI